MPFDKFVGRFRPAIVAVEKIMEHSEHGSWKALIEDTEDKLFAWEHRTIKGNLSRELDRLDHKHKDAHQGAFGRIKIVNHNAVTVDDEPFVFKAVENYFAAMDPGFQTALKELMDRTDAAAQGNIAERYMMTISSEKVKSQSLSDWPHQARSWRCALVLPARWRLLTGEDLHSCKFMDAHVNHHSTRNNTSVAPFFLPNKSSGPDMVFFIRIDGRRMVPVFVQMKLHQSSATLYKKLWERALATFSASCVQDHCKDFQNFCPDNIYISMVVAYPVVCGSRLPPAVEVPKKDACGVQQVVIHVSDPNLSQIFPKEHVEFIDRFKKARKRSADDDDSNDEGCSKKQKS
ncbi:hypothetical protein BGZ93_009340 [Podila epicladia]|nr:hypothetical protein BGZ93_009340 [Podila epicladia]